MIVFNLIIFKKNTKYFNTYKKNKIFKKNNAIYVSLIDA